MNYNDANKSYRTRVVPGAEIIVSWVFVFLWMTVIFLLSSDDADISSYRSDQILVFLVKNMGFLFSESFLEKAFFIRKFAHFFAYFILGILTANVFFRMLKSKVSRQKEGLSGQKERMPLHQKERMPDYDESLRKERIKGHKEPESTERVSCYKAKKVSVMQIAAPSIVFCSAYAMTDELHQLFVPGRAASVRDVLIDTAGATVGALIFILARMFYLRFHTRRMPNAH